MKREVVNESLRAWGLDPAIIKSLSLSPDEAVVEYYVITSGRGKIIDPVQQEAVTTFVTYPLT